jgi:hypothetical protein
MFYFNHYEATSFMNNEHGRRITTKLYCVACDHSFSPSSLDTTRVGKPKGNNKKSKKQQQNVQLLVLNETGCRA